MVQFFSPGLGFVTSFSNYYTVFVFVIFALIVALILYFVSLLVGGLSITREIEKISTYECGFIPFSDSRMKFDISFYIVSILFIIFDLEIVFLFPWSLCFLEIGFVGSISMIFFLWF